MKHFLEEFLRVTETVESPTSFLTWAAFCGVGAILRDNTWFEFKARRNRVYPNLYVLLLADSGESRKSTPMKIINPLIKVANNTKLIEGRASIQGVIRELGNVLTLNGKMIKDASALLYSEEFRAFLVKDPSTTSLLTDLYDFHTSWDVTLKGEEKQILKNVCLSLLTASNEAFLKTMFTPEDLYGGLVGRMVIVKESGPRFKNSGMYDEIEEGIWEPLEHHIRYLATLQSGPAIFTEEAKRYYHDWYMNLNFTNKSGTGWEARVHTTILKLSIILAACEPEWKKLVEKRHIDAAIGYLLPLQKNYLNLVSAVIPKKTTVAEGAQEVISNLLHAPSYTMTYRVLAQNLLLNGGIDRETLDKAIENLKLSNVIIDAGVNGEVAFKPTEDFLVKVSAKIRKK